MRRRDFLLGLSALLASNPCNPTGQLARVNTILVTGGHGADIRSSAKMADALNAALRESLQLADLNLRVAHGGAKESHEAKWTAESIGL